MKHAFTIALLIAVAANGKAQQLAPDPGLMISIYFGGGSYYIDSQQAGALQRFIESFTNIDSYDITVHSHTDNIGSAEYNQMLAERRSHAVVQQLLALKVSRTRISIHDFGEFNPVYDNATYAGRLRNRRVDIILWPRETL